MDTTILAAGIVKNPLNPNEIYLLYHKEIGLWIMPGGHIDSGDTPKYTVEKELWEEIGIEVISCNLIKSGHMDYIDKDLKPHRKKLYLYDIIQYRGFPFNKEPNAHSSLKSFSIDELKKMIKNKEVTSHVEFWLSS